jgi:hypothetical protein
MQYDRHGCLGGTVNEKTVQQIRMSVLVTDNQCSRFIDRNEAE